MNVHLKYGSTRANRLIAGIFLIGISCSNFLFANSNLLPPGNDDLCFSYPKSINQCCEGYDFDNITATTEAFEPGGCGGDIYATVWFDFIAPVSGAVDIYTYPDPATLSTIESVLYHEDPGFDCVNYLGLTEIACSWSGMVGDNLLSVVGLTPGDKYYVRIQTLPPAAGTEFCIEFKDGCALPSIVLYDDPVITVVDDIAELEIDYYTDCPRSYSIFFDEDAGAEGFVNQVDVDFPPPNPYEIEIPIPMGIYPGVYEGTISVSNVCGTSAPVPFTITILEPPVNDDLCDAIPVPVDDSFIYGPLSCTGYEYTTVGATSESYEPAYVNSVWFSFIAPLSGTVDIVTDPEPFGEMSREIYEIGPGFDCSSGFDLLYLDGNNDCSVDDILTVAGLTPGDTYYISVEHIICGSRLNSASSIGGNFCILIEDACTIPAFYAEDIEITIEPDLVYLDLYQTNMFEALDLDYSIDFDLAAESEGFVDQMGVISFIFVDIEIPIPVSAAPGVYNATVTLTHPCGISEPASFTITILPAPVNDDLCDAIPLTMNEPCMDYPYTNVGSTAEPFDYMYSENVWFSFIAPLSGSVNIITEIDPEAVMFSWKDRAVYVPGDSFDCSTGNDLILVEENSDCIDFGLLTLSGLTPMQLYYIEIDVAVCKGPLPTGAFCIEVIDNCPCPSISIDNSPEVCSGNTSAFLYYSMLMEDPTDYSIDFDAAAELEGFIDQLGVFPTPDPGIIEISLPISPAADTYNANLVVSKGCCSSLPIPFTVSILESPGSVVFSGDAMICSGDCTNLSFMITGGTPPFYVEYDNTMDYISIPDYQSGDPIQVCPGETTTYEALSVTDDNGCTVDVGVQTVEVVVNDNPSGSFLYGGGEICEGESTDIFVSVSGGSSPFTVEYSDGMNTFLVNNYMSDDPISVSPPVTTTYTLVSVTDANGCEDFTIGGGLTTGTVTNMRVLPIAAMVVVNPSPGGSMLYGGGQICEGFSAPIFFSIPGGTPPYTVEYSDGMNNFVVNNYQSDDPIFVSPAVDTDYFPVSVIDANGCMGGLDGFVSVIVLPSPGATLLYGGGEICLFESIPIFFSIPGGTPPYTVEYTDGMNDFVEFNYQSDDPIFVSPTVNTDYTPTNVYDANECQGELAGMASVIVHPNPDNVSISGGGSICEGESIDIYFTISGGTAPYTVEYSDGMNNFVVNNYQSGDPVSVSPLIDTDYTPFLVTDANGCPGEGGGEVHVEVFELIQNATLTGGGTICEGETIDIFLSITGGASPYTVEYTDGMSNYVVNNYQNNDPISVNPVSSSDFSLVNVTDSNGCSGPMGGLASIVVNETPDNSFLGGGGTICEGESAIISVFVMGGTPPFTVTYIDGVDEYTIENYFSPDPIIVSPSETSFYTPISVFDANGCESMVFGFAAVIVNEGLENAVLQGGGDICFGESAVISFFIPEGTGPFVVEYSDGQNDFVVNNYFSEDAILVSPVETTEYVPVSIADANGCLGNVSGSAFVNVNESIEDGILEGGGLVCLGESEEIFFSISGGVPPYIVEYTDGNSNFIENNYISGDPVVVIPVETTQYDPISIMDAEGCQAMVTGMAIIEVAEGPVMAEITGGDQICAGDNTELSFNILGGSSPFSIEYSDGDNVFILNSYENGDPVPINPTENTTYFPVSIIDAQGCAGPVAGEVLVEVYEGPESAELQGGESICLGESSMISFEIIGGTGPFTVEYTDGNQNYQLESYQNGDPIELLPDETTTYSPVNVIDANGCSVDPTGEALIEVLTGPESAMIIGDDVVCSGESTSISFIITGGLPPYTIEYTDGNQNYQISDYQSGDPVELTPSVSITYSPVSILDANACSGEIIGSASIEVLEAPQTAIIDGDQQICLGEVAEISFSISGGTPPYTIEYSDGMDIFILENYESGTPLQFSPEESLTISLISVSGQNNCITSFSDSVIIHVNTGPESAELSGDASLCLGEVAAISFAIIGGTGLFTVEYTDGNQNYQLESYQNGDPIELFPNETTNYSPVTVIDANGCSVLPTGEALIEVLTGPESAMIIGDHTICSGESTSISFVITGGIAPYTIEYTDGNQNFLLSDYQSGDPVELTPSASVTYSPVSILDANACSGEIIGSASIEVLEAPQTAIIDGDQQICLGEVVEISFSITGGASPYTIEYTDGMNIFILENYESGTPLQFSPEENLTISLISVSGQNNCITSFSDSVIIEVNTGPESTELSGDASLCLGEVAAVSFAIIGGTPPYSVEYSDGMNVFMSDNYQSGDPIIVMPMETTEYTPISVTDANGCDGMGSGSATIIVSEGQGSSMMSGDGMICQGESTIIRMDISGGTPPFAIEYSDGQEVFEISNYQSGDPILVSPASTTVYVPLNVMDQDGCVGDVSGSALVEVSEAPQQAFIIGNTAICQGEVYVFSIEITGGTAPFELQYTSGSDLIILENYLSGESIEITPPNSLTLELLQITDTNNCSLSTEDQLEVVVFERPELAELTGSTDICKAESANIVITITGGAAPYSIQYSDGSEIVSIDEYQSGTPISVSPETSTDYIPVSVVDANGCSGEVSGMANVMVFDGPQSSVLEGDDQICYGETTSISLTILGGSAPYDVQISTGEEELLIEDYLSGEPIPVSPDTETSYSVLSVIDANGCVSPTSGTAFIEVFEGPEIAELVGDNEICFGENTSISFTIVGGSSPYVVSYTDGEVEFEVENYFSGDQIQISPEQSIDYLPVTVVDANGCEGEVTGFASLIVNLGPEGAELKGGNDICEGETTSIYFDISGGTPPFIVEYTDGSNNYLVENYQSTDLIQLTPENPSQYIPVSILDANGCTGALSGMVSVDVFEGPEMAILQGDASICQGEDANISFTISGGTAPYTVEYSDGQGSFVINNYFSGDPILVAPNTTTEYQPVQIADANGCQAPTNGLANIEVFPGLESAEIMGGGTICDGESASIFFDIIGGTPPYSIEYTDGSNIIMISDYQSEDPIELFPVVNTQYSPINILDVNGCSGQVSGVVSVEVFEGPEMTVLEGSASICQGEDASISFTILGGTAPYSIEYSDGEESFFVNDYFSGDPILVSPNISTDYNPVQIFDANACVGPVEGIAQIEVFPAPESAEIMGGGTICEGESSFIYFVINGGTAPYTLEYSDGESSLLITDYESEELIELTPAKSTEYTGIRVIDANGCETPVTGTAEIQLISGEIVAEFTGSNTICIGESTDLQITISNGNPPYHLVYTDGENIIDIEDYMGEAITVNPLTTTSYSIISISDQCGEAIELPANVLVSVENIPVISLVDQYCSEDHESYTIELITDGDLISTSLGSLVMLGDMSFEINNIPIDQSVIITSTTSVADCSIEISVDPLECICPFIAAPTSTGDAEICENENIPALSVSVDPGLIANWYDMAVGGNILASASLNYTPSGAGTYYVEAIDELNACTSTLRTAISLSIFDLPTPLIQGPETLCIGQTDVQLETENMWDSYQWSTGEESSTIIVNMPGEYAVTVTDQNSCTGVASFAVAGFSLPEPLISISNDLCMGATTILSLEKSYSTILWEDGSSTQQIEVSQAGTYGVTVVDENGCSGVTEVELELNEGTVFESNFLTNKQICLGDTLHFIDISDPMATISSYNWDFGDGTISTERDPVHVYNSPGIFNVQLEAIDNDCINYSEVKQVEVLNCRRNIFDESGFVSINVFPNPSSGQITIHVELIEELDALIQVFNAQGILCKSSTMTGKVYEDLMNFEDSGIYFVKIATPYHSKIKKIIIHK